MRRPTGRLAQVNYIMRLVFDAAADPQAWPAVINALADAMDASFASISFFDARTQTFAALAPRVDPADIRIYQEEWATRNELWRRSIAAPEGAILRPYAFVPRDEFIRSDYVVGYFTPRGMEASVGTNVLVEDLASTMIHVNRSLQIGDFTEDEVDLFAAVLPSIQRGVQ